MGGVVVSFALAGASLAGPLLMFEDWPTPAVPGLGGAPAVRLPGAPPAATVESPSSKSSPTRYPIVLPGAATAAVSTATGGRTVTAATLRAPTRRAAARQRASLGAESVQSGLSVLPITAFTPLETVELPFTAADEAPAVPSESTAPVPVDDDQTGSSPAATGRRAPSLAEDIDDEAEAASDTTATEEPAATAEPAPADAAPAATDADPASAEEPAAQEDPAPVDAPEPVIEPTAPAPEEPLPSNDTTPAEPAPEPTPTPAPEPTATATDATAPAGGQAAVKSKNHKH